MPNYPSQAAFFCGHSTKFCDTFESKELLSKAMENVEKYFAVVGVLEVKTIFLLKLINSSKTILYINFLNYSFCNK